MTTEDIRLRNGAPSEDIPYDDDFVKSIRDGAGGLLAEIVGVEKLLESLLPPQSDPSTIREAESRLARSEVLPFLIRATAFEDEELVGVLKAAQFSNESIEQIKATIGRYRFLKHTLLRIFRRSQGYENEISGVTCQPLMFLKSHKVAVGLEVYSYDKLLFSSREEIGDLLGIVCYLLDIVCDTVEYAASIDPEMARASLDDDTIAQFQGVADRFAKLVTPPTTEGNNAVEHAG